MPSYKLNKSQLLKKEKGLCVEHGCDNEGRLVYRGKPKQYRQSKCSKHRSWDYRFKPYTLYHRKKGHAKAKGKPFNWTYEEFKEFCEETGFIELKKKDPYNWTIDRIDELRGYEKGNVQVLRRSYNAIKYQKWCESQMNKYDFRDRSELEEWKQEETDKNYENLSKIDKKDETDSCPF